LTFTVFYIIGKLHKSREYLINIKNNDKHNKKTKTKGKFWK
jgi:hypothetical protein